jgi:uncharacterized protein (DUF2461 family)
MNLLKHPITSLLIGIAIGVIVMIFMVMKAPLSTQFDPKPYQDSIRVLQAEKVKERAEGNSHVNKADSAVKSVTSRKPKLKHDIEVVKVFTPDLRLHFHDSVMRAAGLR